MHEKLESLRIPKKAVLGKEEEAGKVKNLKESNVKPSKSNVTRRIIRPDSGQYSRDGEFMYS